MIPYDGKGQFIGLPDNGYGAQGSSADFTIGFDIVTPSFKTKSDGTTSRGPVTVGRFTPFTDPKRLLDLSFITDGPVYNRATITPPVHRCPWIPPSATGRF